MSVVLRNSEVFSSDNRMYFWGSDSILSLRELWFLNSLWLQIFKLIPVDSLRILSPIKCCPIKKKSYFILTINNTINDPPINKYKKEEEEQAEPVLF